MKYWVHEEGSKGQEVKRIQQVLNLEPDGDFGPITKQAVKQYQSENGLTIDSKVGPATRASMAIEIYAGIDISAYQKNIDWNTLKQSGLANFCWIKTTEGNSHVQKTIKSHFSGAKSVNIPAGGYHFARPDLHDDPHKEIENFAKNCPVFTGGMRPVLDFETAGAHTANSLRDWVLTFLRQTEKKLGTKPILYTGGNMVKYHLNRDTTGLDEYELWHAYYSQKAFKSGIKKDRLGNWNDWSIWQWTGSGSIQGIPGDVDRNWLPGGESAFSNLRVR
tara:strand:- start:5219 stop:6046 length:828 start_codon:yes stop_codon:yes gene_type:complete